MGKNNKILSVYSLYIILFCIPFNSYATMAEDWLYEIEPPTYYYKPSNQSMFYPTAYGACVARMPAPYVSGGNTLITHSDPNPAYDSSYGLGCTYRVVDSNVSTGQILQIIDPSYKQHWISKYRVCALGFNYNSEQTSVGESDMFRKAVAR
ncbi:MAG: hypothetical protein IPK65_13965 [Gammaproteobacteria bacterium]|nr:hypothetical protein [Gammaproteobacteria bacterium]